MTETSDNAFLGGRLNILQPKVGYRAGADPVFLAAAVGAKPGQTALDLGCGVGTAMLCLATRVPGLELVGVELQSELAALARENLSRNSLSGDVWQADISAMPHDLKARRFDHVMTNPPFFDRKAGSRAADAGREQGRGETIDVDAWLGFAIERIEPKGSLTVVNRIERLPDCLTALQGKVGHITVLPLAPRIGRPSKLFVLNAIRGSKGAFCLRSPLVLHTGVRHETDGDSYTEQAQAILRGGAALLLRD